MARKTTYKSKSSKKPYGRKKTSTGPRRSVKKSKPAAKKFTKRQMATYVSLVREKRTPPTE